MSNYQDFINGTTQDKAKYIRAWESHIDTLASLAYPLVNASEEIELMVELQEIQDRLKELVQIAADEDFKDE